MLAMNPSNSSLYLPSLFSKGYNQSNPSEQLVMSGFQQPLSMSSNITPPLSPNTLSSLSSPKNHIRSPSSSSSSSSSPSRFMMLPADDTVTSLISLYSTNSPNCNNNTTSHILYNPEDPPSPSSATSSPPSNFHCNNPPSPPPQQTQTQNYTRDKAHNNNNNKSKRPAPTPVNVPSPNSPSSTPLRPLSPQSSPHLSPAASPINSASAILQSLLPLRQYGSDTFSSSSSSSQFTQSPSLRSYLTNHGAPSAISGSVDAVAADNVPPKRVRPSSSAGLRKSPNKWTKEENHKLFQLVSLYGEKKWKRISAEMGSQKTGAQCAQHWKRVLSPEIRKGPWEEEEEALLLKLVAQYGSCWKKIAKKISKRTDIQCRYQYLKARQSREAPWVSKEDEVMLKKVSELGSSLTWLEVSEYMAKLKHTSTLRTALECKERYEVLTGRVLNSVVTNTNTSLSYSSSTLSGENEESDEEMEEEEDDEEFESPVITSRGRTCTPPSSTLSSSGKNNHNNTNRSSPQTNVRSSPRTQTKQSSVINSHSQQPAFSLVNATSSEEVQENQGKFSFSETKAEWSSSISLTKSFTPTTGPLPPFSFISNNYQASIPRPKESSGSYSTSPNSLGNSMGNAMINNKSNDNGLGNHASAIINDSNSNGNGNGNGNQNTLKRNNPAALTNGKESGRDKSEVPLKKRKHQSTMQSNVNNTQHNPTPLPLSSSSSSSSFIPSTTLTATGKHVVNNNTPIVKREKLDVMSITNGIMITHAEPLEETGGSNSILLNTNGFKFTNTPSQPLYSNNNNSNSNSKSKSISNSFANANSVENVTSRRASVADGLYGASNPSANPSGAERRASWSHSGGDLRNSGYISKPSSLRDSNFGINELIGLESLASLAASQPSLLL